MTDFPSQVQGLQAPAQPGDFASANPKTMVVAGPGALIAGRGVIDGVLVDGAVVGRFGWLSYEQVDGNNAPAVLNTYGSGRPAGLVRRTMQGLITVYLATAVQFLQRGFQIEAFSVVDMWVKNAGAGQALKDMKAFAKFADGSVSFAAAGATPSGGSGSASSIAAATWNAHGVIVDNVLTVDVVNSGSIYPGSTIASGGAATGTKIVSQLTPLLAGEALAGVGRYTLSIANQSVAAATFGGTYGVLTVGGSVTGSFSAGETITGSGITDTTTVYQQLTGSPGVAGTYVVDVNTVVNSTAITSADSIETDFYCLSPGLSGESVMIGRLSH